MARRTDNPLALSQRSNNLQFSCSPYFQSPPSHHHTRSIYLYTDPRSLCAEAGRPVKKHQPNPPISDAHSLASPGPAVSTAPQYTQRPVSSLITPVLSSKPVKRTSKKSSHPHRLSSSASSIRSAASSNLSRKRKYYYEHPKLSTLPSEILDEIFQRLDQDTLLALAKASRRMFDEAAHTLYASPSFASTYRLAQFVSVVSQNCSLARMVRTLDLSNLSCVDPDVPLAGWREWKFRSSRLYTTHRDDLQDRKKSGQRENRLATLKSSTHPLPSPLLNKYSTSRDVPVGGIVHILRACPHLRELNLSNVPLAPDYSVRWTITSTYRPVASTGLLFVSDVPKSFTWKEGDTRPLHASVDLAEAILSLKCLKRLKIKGGLWVTRDVARRIVERSEKLEKVDFRECGMYKDICWAVEGQRDKIKEVIEKELQAELRKRQSAASP
ncbi:hypothetical protein C7212DRAFT_272663 [Tuber magnatum]|uniref:F-box domain-containing protein n=1 Tax=Tuber magnatum TaxID=42249 RepID=A0A317SXP2_9PEZI|nr:hypothetical protein C7212DRAFT_272663 [Tuber magnatum]